MASGAREGGSSGVGAADLHWMGLSYYRANCASDYCFTRNLRRLIECPYLRSGPTLWLASPALIILLAALLYRAIGKGYGVELYQQFVSMVLIFGALSIFLGVAQGMGIGWVVDFLSTFYTRDLNMEDVLEYGRAYGTFDGQPNVFGTFCGLYILLLLNRMKSLTSLLVLAPLIVGAGLELFFLRLSRGTARVANFDSGLGRALAQKLWLPRYRCRWAERGRDRIGSQRLGTFGLDEPAR